MNDFKIVSIVVPMYNESETAELFFETVNKCTAGIRARKSYIRFEIVAVNDGSTDDTLQKLISLRGVYPDISVLSLSRNFGQEPAVFAGLEKAKGDAVVVMDCDLQDPPETLAAMIDKWEEGYDIVNARRVLRKSDTKLKRETADLYYNILNRLSDKKIKYPHNVNNFRLVSRRVLDIILAMPEKNKFYRGIVPFAGFKSADIEVERKKRLKGVSKYSFREMARLAVYGVTATTTKPLSWALGAGMFFGAAGFLGGVALAALAACGISFNASLWGVLCGLSFFTGANIFFTGINGLYLGKGYEEIRQRPFYIVDSYMPAKNSGGDVKE